MTVRFFLVRHAKAEKHAVTDAARRLTEEGRDRFLAHARQLKQEGALEVARIVTSPLVRTLETADLLAGVTGASVEEHERLASGAATGAQLLALARRLGAGVALVGHNPEIAEAIALAAGGAGEPPEVKPGTVALVEVGTDGERLVWLRGPTKP